MSKLICDHYGKHDECWFCSHGEENHKEPTRPWKEPEKLCTDVHTCEICITGVKCVEIVK